MEKVRKFVRSCSYLVNPKKSEVHESIDRKHNLSEDLLELDNIAEKNVSLFINGKKIKEAVKLVPAYVTEDEKVQAEKIENKTIAELQVFIFQKIKNLSIERQELQEEIYQKTVRNKNKAKYVKFYYILCELEEKEVVEKMKESIDEECIEN